MTRAMIRGGLYASLSMLALSGQAWAQSVNVRAGEHADFTRLVFNLPDRMEVALRYRSDGVDLLFERDGLTFDTDTVFERVPTTRLVAMSPDAATMALTLNCKCDVDTFWAGDRAFVIDIGDETEVSVALFPSEPTPASSEETDAPVDAPSSDQATPVEIAEPAEQTTQQTRAMDLLSETGKPSLGSVAFLINDAFDRQEELRMLPEPVVTENASRLRDSQDAILTQIGRAATQGLLSPRADLQPTPEAMIPSPTPSSGDTVQTTRSNTAETAAGEIAQSIMLNAETSIDQAYGARSNIALGEEDRSGCLNPARVNTNEWGGEGSFVDQIGTLRSDILGEFDEPSAKAIKKLARFYVHFGFGAEAMQVLEMLPKGKAKDPALAAMVNILEHGHDGANSVLAGHMTCDPIVAMWSLLSYEDVPGNQPIDPDAIVRGMLSLPLHLRAYLGPIIGDKLRVAGYPRAADHVVRVLARNDETMSIEADYLNAQNDAVAPDTRPAEADLGAVVADNGALSAEALLQLIEGRLTEGDALSEDMALLAGAYATEHRDQPMGPKLARAYVLSLASSGDFDDAFSEFDRLTEANPVPKDGTLSNLMDMVSKSASDPTFLTFTISGDPSMRFSLSDAVGNQVANRLMDLGFPEAAAHFVIPMARGEAERARKLLRAEIALRQERPRQAELELLGESGEDVMDLIARARSMAGEHSAARDIYAQMDKDDKALRQAWLDEDWETLQSHSDPAIAAMATRQSAPASVANQDVTQVLARNAAMIDDSQSMRSEIEALLSGITIPESDPSSDP